MNISIFQVDAFTDVLFGGNPAAICPLDQWLEDSLMQNIAMENNLSETAFFIPLPNGNFHLRWFTPEIEMDLCGHATLASAYVIFEELNFEKDKIVFETKSGLLEVNKTGELLELDFPSRPPSISSLPKIISQGLSIQPREVWKARDYMLVYDTQDQIRGIKPNISILNQINLDPGGIIVTAEGKSSDIDFVSRFFTPRAAVFEDPVTGSAHCTLIPFWSQRLNKSKMRALQLSNRGGQLYCEIVNQRVKIRGRAVKYLKGTIHI